MCLILLCVGVLATTSSVDVALDIAISCLLNIHFPHLLIQKFQLYSGYHCGQTKTEQTKIHFSGSHTHMHTHTHGWSKKHMGQFLGAIIDCIKGVSWSVVMYLFSSTRPFLLNQNSGIMLTKGLWAEVRLRNSVSKAGGDSFRRINGPVCPDHPLNKNPPRKHILDIQ